MERNVSLFFNLYNKLDKKIREHQPDEAQKFNSYRGAIISKTQLLQMLIFRYENSKQLFDAWMQEAEEKLGKALKPYRNNIFLACKTTERDAKGSEEELNISLKRVRVDHFDLYQFHAVTEMEEVEKIFAPKGAVETFVKAQKEGKIRFIGFSAHSEEAALALLDRFEFNSILFPINFVSYARGNFGPRVVEKAKEKGASRLALKVLAHTPIPDEVEKKYPKCWYKPVDDESLAEKALRFALSQDITAAIPPGDENLYKIALSLAMRFKPMDDEEINQLFAQTRNLEPLFPL